MNYYSLVKLYNIIQLILYCIRFYLFLIILPILKLQNYEFNVYMNIFCRARFSKIGLVCSI